MEIIETGDPDAFKAYLREYENTICGRHPISVFLHVNDFLSMIVNGYLSFYYVPHPPCIKFSFPDVETLLNKDQDWLCSLRAVEPVQEHEGQQCELCIGSSES